MALSKPLDIVEYTLDTLPKLGIEKDTPLLLSVSGGVDSMTLAHALLRLAKKGHCALPGVAHINHQLREIDSDADEAFVREFALANGLPFFSRSVDVLALAEKEHRSVEDAARVARYTALVDIASANGYQTILTAHHAADVVETILINLVRGAGVRGLAGIPPRRMLAPEIFVVRPWLELPKQEITNWAQKNKVAFRVDSSNLTKAFLRNRIRQSVLPALQDAFSDRDIYQGILKSSENVRETDLFIRSLALDQLQDLERPLPSRLVARYGKALDRSLVDLPKVVFREAVRLAVSSIAEVQVTLDRDQSALLEEFRQGTTFSWSYFNEVSLYVEDDLIIFEKVRTPLDFFVELREGSPVHTEIGELRLEQGKVPNFSANTDFAYFDAAELGGRELAIRPWAEGDRIKPFGMGGHSKLVSDLLSEAGVKTERLKHFVPVVVLQDDPSTILWVPGVRAADFARVSASTETVLIMSRKPNW